MRVTAGALFWESSRQKKKLTSHIALIPHTALIMCNARHWFTIPVPSVPELVYFADISSFNSWHAIC